MSTSYIFLLYREEAAIREEAVTHGGTKGPHDSVPDVVLV